MPSAISTYVSSLQAQPLQFRSLDHRELPGACLHRYLLQSQTWPTGATARPWQHQVDIVIPTRQQPGPALLLVNNRSPFPHSSCADDRPTDVDFDAASIAALMRDGGPTIISVAQLPNQPLWLPGESQALNEDALVAASWQAFMTDRAADPSLPLQVPMTAAVIRAMDLWQQLHGPGEGLIVAGVSKRAGAAWLTAMNDRRVVALASLGLDIHFQAVLGHIQQAHHGQWPVALAPYVSAGITTSYQSQAFARLMQIIDPWAQRASPAGLALHLPKLVVNASGDDFFPPDCPSLYAADLPPTLGLHTLPNCDHAGIRRHVASSLVPFVRRVRAGLPLPVPDCRAAGTTSPGSRQSEVPEQLTWWHAHNPVARDFRFNQGIRYQARQLPLQQTQLPPLPPAPGWHASYLEWRYADGLQLSSPVQVSYQA